MSVMAVVVDVSALAVNTAEQRSKASISPISVAYTHRQP
jgi:hypothetical protein